MAKTATYSLIQEYTVPSNTASVTLNSIPGTFTDLVLVSNYGLSGDYDSRFYINNESTGTNYSMTNMRYVESSTVASSRYSSNAYFVWGLQSVTVPSTLTSNAIYHFLDYANTSTYKTVIGQVGDANAQVIARVGLWRSTAAISRLDISCVGGNILAGTTFRIYGVEAGNA